MRAARRSIRVRMAAIVIILAGALGWTEERARTFAFPTKTNAPLSDPFDPAAIARAGDEILDRAHEVTGFGGCALVAVHGHVALDRCVGAGHAPPPAVPARISIGSLWKAFLGPLVHRAAHEGRLRLADPIARHLPELSDAPCADVTIAQLLAHTSGLPHDVRLTTNLLTQLSSAQRTDADFLAEVRRYPLDFPPGTRFGYSNPGYGLLAILLGRLDARPWKDVLRDLFRGVGMNDTGFLDTPSPGSAPLRGSMPLRCGLLAGGPCMHTLPRWKYSMLPGGGVYSTVEDLFAWDRALAHVERDDPALAADAFRPGPFEGYASGWFVGRETLAGGEEVTIERHSGEDPGYQSYIARIPAKDALVVVLSTTDYSAAHAARPVAAALEHALLGHPYDVHAP